MNITKPQVFTAILSLLALGLICAVFAGPTAEKIVLAVVVAISNLGMRLLENNK